MIFGGVGNPTTSQPHLKHAKEHEVEVGNRGNPNWRAIQFTIISGGTNRLYVTIGRIKNEEGELARVSGSWSLRSIDGSPVYEWVQTTVQPKEIAEAVWKRIQELAFQENINLTVREIPTERRKWWTPNASWHRTIAQAGENL
ncbi:MAG: hypothetical protein C4584_00165 [Armatimonadetes bacterium]|nr:MAG: hypothetical protein C4584_00165 [Armatimonadota bacterium]